MVIGEGIKDLTQLKYAIISIVYSVLILNQGVE